MKIAILQFSLRIDHAHSLKDKRSVVRSLKDRLHREHQVSVAEIGALDVWNRAELGLVACARDAARLTAVLDAVLAKIKSLPDAVLQDAVSDIVGVDDLTPDTADDGTPLWTPDERRETPDRPPPGPPGPPAAG